MRLNQDQLRFLNAGVPEAAKSPILHKLEQLEELIRGIPIDQSYDDEDLLECLGRIEELVSERKPVSYNFDITRNANGTLAKIVATPVRT